ncbi:ABC transporter ATP-binding protein [Sphingomonas sp. MA1305]|uniref:ATP-binding cassette domain-containing protein n=1 Tax=Sphingomonas sp. MA1305 TaxID=2479204 RepID=UPI0018E05621|nr:ABC transporter ATP-binding protein [Sphingomonas sp. MA1305]MBI0474288.1 ABC transporter ATP-binding protein [Sphingomonas sp. MA1305]
MIAIHLAEAIVAREGHRVVHGIDLSVAPGTWFGIVGANGSGKTSLLRAVSGRLPFVGGTCRIGGRDLTDDRAARARAIGFAPPADRLPDLLRGRELLDYARGDAPLDAARLADLWAALGIPALLDRWIGECSAGMRQRLAIAAAFAGGHRCIVLDEPFNWLDPVAAYDVRQVLRRMTDDGLTLVTALHDLGTLAGACDAGLMLANGRVAAMLDRAALCQAADDPRQFERVMIERLRRGG